MALDPSIFQNIRPQVDFQKSGQNVLSAAQTFQNIRGQQAALEQEKTLAPLRQQLIESQISSQQAAQSKATQDAQFKQIGFVLPSLKSALDSGDLGEVTRIVSQMPQDNPLTQDALRLIQAGDVEGLKQGVIDADTALTRGGFIDAPTVEKPIALPPGTKLVTPGGEFVAQGSPQDKRTALQKNLTAGGLVPGTEPFRKAMLQAIKKPGQSFTVSPDGTIEFTTGVLAHPTLGKPVVKNLQETIISGEQNLSRLDRIVADYEPKFLTFAGQIGASVTALKSKFGANVSKENKEFLKSRRKFTQGVNTFFNAYRKEITGAAAAVAELEGLKKAVLNEDLSPIEFEAAVEQFREEVLRINRLNRRILREGLTGKKGQQLDLLFSAGEDDNIEARGAELEAQNVPFDQIMKQLKSEGFRVQ